jgi:hypothetical protein
MRLPYNCSIHHAKPPLYSDVALQMMIQSISPSDIVLTPDVEYFQRR